jgi:glycosyltransferase involved in cell wall biosynthesis
VPRRFLLLQAFFLLRTLGLAYPLCVTLSVVIIAHNEEVNIGRTLTSVQPLVAEGRGEILLVDSGSTDRTVEIAKSLGAKVFVEEWKGYAAQKNSAIEKATGTWILSLDADEEVDAELVAEIRAVTGGNAPALTSPPGFRIPRKNFFLGRWIKHGGFWPDPKLRLFRRDAARFGDRAVHEDARLGEGTPGQLKSALLHHSYPTLAEYVDHMNRYSSLGAEMAVARNQNGFGVIDIVFRPAATFIYNYIFRLGFLDGREGLLLHLYHAVYVSWKYAKAWELVARRNRA